MPVGGRRGGASIPRALRLRLLPHPTRLLTRAREACASLRARARVVGSAASRVLTPHVCAQAAPRRVPRARSRFVLKYNASHYAVKRKPDAALTATRPARSAGASATATPAAAADVAVRQPFRAGSFNFTKADRSALGCRNTRARVGHFGHFGPFLSAARITATIRVSLLLSLPSLGQRTDPPDPLHRGITGGEFVLGFTTLGKAGSEPDMLGMAVCRVPGAPGAEPGAGSWVEECAHDHAAPLDAYTNEHAFLVNVSPMFFAHSLVRRTMPRLAAFPRSCSRG